MIEDLPPAQNALMLVMSYMSEEAYEASWMTGLEFALWNAVINGPQNYGRLFISNEHINVLKLLSEYCNGWIIWEKKSNEFISLDDWHSKFNIELPLKQKYLQ